ncbi:aldehyde dehydrogenase family protein [Micromonospora sp. WMMD1102]|uniref:aldehyde dehydrogenase family protein n=1 Tax=Micromonospora sp. WMMD1102 TaxID=3016105 RepID=UPI0024158C29|nr:aldehyde dehydrogenase family protein [Micromonospora sp. WMMD1102]MDG4785131.1 aldehyde dehydrogenase family protein [Micromonospora sp. WMMD1102]
MRHYPSLIGGKDVDSDRHVYGITARALLTDTFDGLALKRRLESGQGAPEDDPRVAGRCALADRETSRQALAAAAAAVPEWRATPLRTRLRFGDAIHRRLVETRDEFVEVMVAEGRPRTAAGGEVDGLLDIFSEQTLAWCGELLHREFSHGGKRIVLRRRPDGVVCVAPPQNAPHSNAIYGAASLLAGNAVVVRAPRSLPLGVMYAIREIVAPALDEVGAPPGTVNVVCGPPMFDDWLASPHVDDVIYFGGSAKGLALQNDCVAAGKKPILELAGNDCAVVWRDADLDLAVGALTEAFNASGQICNIPNQVVVHPAIADELLERLRAAAGRVRPGFPDDEGVELTPVLAAEAYFATLHDALERGARLVCGGRRLEVDGSPSETGYFVEPTVLRVDGLVRSREVAAVREETFFPLLPVVVPEAGRDDDALLADVVDFVNGNAYGLRNSFWSTDDAVVDRFLAGVVNGGVIKVNDESHCGFYPYLPSHGGTGLTGGVFGEASYMAVRTTHLQAVSRRGMR